MELPPAIQYLEEQPTINSIAESVQNTVTELYDAAGEPGHAIKNFLHGTWLGHPLHPILTDIPIGAWTTAVAMDTVEMITGSESAASAADAAVAVGLVGAVGAAVTGITDWKETDGGARNLGLTHALLNISATMLMTGSLIARKRDARGWAKGLALAGWALTGISSYLGGKLVYREQIGVDHSFNDQLEHRYQAVLAEKDLPENKLTRIEVDDKRVLLVKQEGEIYAIAEVCSHLGGPLAEGALEGDTVRCPWHGSCFSLKDGSVVDGPTTHPQPCYETRVRNGQIEVRGL